jgi:hypothetical protein
VSPLERVARGFADDVPLTRRDVAVRGLLGALALGTAGAWRAPFAGAAALAVRCTSLPACLKAADRAAARAVDQCTRTEAYHGVRSDFGSDWACWVWAGRPAKEKAEEACYDRCPPPPAPRTPKKTHQTSRKSKAPPPPLPPNPHDGIAAECANCAQIGGKCCYGQEPTRLCACANASLPCERYGCGS